MPFVRLNSADVANAQLGINLPVILGYARGRGNEVMNHEVPSTKNRIVIRIASEGECDGLDALFINAKRINPLDTTIVHFHPGVDGTLGHGLTADSTGGDQLVDTFWSQLPANFQATTFSRKCYLMFNVAPDPGAPTATLDIIYDLRGLVLRQFDATGTQTGYQFSTNGAEQILEVILRSMLKPEWNPSAARAAGGDLLAAEKARIDFPSFADSVSWCNTLLANGQKRFESSLAITQATSAQNVISQLAMMSQLYVVEDSGVIYIRADKPRASTFTLSADHVVEGTTQLKETNLHGAQNRFIGTFNDLSAQDIVDINAPSGLGLIRSGTGTVTVVCKANHPFTVNQYVQVCFPIDGSVHDAGFDGVWQITALPAANQFSYAQSGNANWLPWSEQFDHPAWTKQTNVTVTANNQTDPLGGNTADTISTGATAAQGVYGVSALPSTNGVQATFSVWLKAAANTAVTLKVNRAAGAYGPGSDTESLAITVTNAWQRFSIPHSATWTGSQFVAGTIEITNATTSIFAWGAQIEDGAAATTYRQTTALNMLLWTEQFNNAAWTKQTGVTVTADNQTDPLGGTTADTISTGATAAQGVFSASGITTFNGAQFTFSVWLKAAANTPVTLRVNRSAGGIGSDTESLSITVTNAWQRFSITHSATWTGNQFATALISLDNANSSVFAWGAQQEYGAAVNTYISQSSLIVVNGNVSGNGYAGTPESKFAVRAPVVDHGNHQLAIGQRGLNLTPIARYIPSNLNFGNNTDERVRRALNFYKNRNLGLDATPYAAPWGGTVTCLMDAVDAQSRSLIEQLCGDIITLDATVSEEFQADYEIMDAKYVIPALDGGVDLSNASSGAPTIELTLLQYLSGAFSDVSQVAQAVRASISGGLAPIAVVDSAGTQHLKGTFSNNPVNSNGTLTGANPLTQSGTSNTINVAAFTMQFGDGQVSYNSGSVNPGALGTWGVYCIDPYFTGGTVTFLATQSTHARTSGNGIVWIGTITTVSAGGGSGTGGGTGSGGGTGGGIQLPNN